MRKQTKIPDAIYIDVSESECVDTATLPMKLPLTRRALMERVLKIGSQKYTKVMCIDEPGAGNACHSYMVETIPQSDCDHVEIVGEVRFQNGPIKESGVNGLHNEDLLAIVIDRLRGFQSGKFACRENAIALTKLEEALHWLNHRTQERVKRGVEGKNIL